MPEGLSAMEVQHEAERHEKHAAQLSGRRGKILQVSEALVLALVTITAAWTGFAAAKWGTESRLQLSEASTARLEANRAEFSAQTTRNLDSGMFAAWFVASAVGNEEKMAVAERRFRPEFRTAFDAWLATDPDHNPNAPAGPTYMPQYRLAESDKAASLDAQAAELAAAGEQSGIVGDDYIRITVVLAGVLFLVGIGSTFTVASVRFGLLTVGALLLVGALVLIAQQPGPPS
jgi:hypothetical protein